MMETPFRTLSGWGFLLLRKPGTGLLVRLSLPRSPRRARRDSRTKRWIRSFSRPRQLAFDVFIGWEVSLGGGFSETPVLNKSLPTYSPILPVEFLLRGLPALRCDFLTDIIQPPWQRLRKQANSRVRRNALKFGNVFHKIAIALGAFNASFAG